MVPLRAIFEALGASVGWDDATKTVMAQKGSDKVQLTVQNTTAFKNGVSITLDASPVIINGSTLVPTRFVASALGAVVGWDDVTKTVSIRTAGEKQTVPVTSVVDGDTLKVTINGEEETIRLLLVDTPETKHPDKDVQPFGPEATAFAKETLEGNQVIIEFDVSERDKYGYVWVEGKMFNEMLLEKGLARVAYVYPPNVKYVDQFRGIEKQAQKAGVGIWSIENYVQADGFHK